MPDGGDDLAIDRLGERALLVRAPTQARVHGLASTLGVGGQGGVADVVPGDRSLLIRFGGTDDQEAAIRAILAAPDRPIAVAPRERVIPVRYGGLDGPDLDEVASLTGRSAAAVVERHAAVEHTVLFIGFAPGFPYLGGLPDDLVVPRLATPRTVTPPGSVAIAEGYTGIYPAPLPGGWRVIGRTDVRLFDPTATPPARLAPGDRVRFEPVP